MTQTINLNEVKVGPRMRGEMGSLELLKDSIRRHGLVHPIVLDADNNLVAGERRLRAHRELGLEQIQFTRREQMSDDERAELEFEENYFRKQFTWQEECLGILDIYRKKKRQGALQGFRENWHAIVSEMFGMSVSTVNYVLLVAKKLDTERNLPEANQVYWKFQSANEAYRMGILKEEEDKQNRLASLSHVMSAPTAAVKEDTKRKEELRRELSVTDVELADRKARYESNPLNTVPFEVYWAEKQKAFEDLSNTVYLSRSIHQVNCIEFMLRDENRNTFDHIITDPPYAINMDNLNQQNQHGGLADLDRVVEAHQVEENLDLLKKFFPAAFQCTKEKAFLVLCCDNMVWQFLYDQATAAGWLVQRWPYIWRKVNQSCMNNCAGYNTTKDYEPIMLCRKPSATLMEKRNTSFTEASNVEVTRLTGHPFAKPFELTRDLLKMVSLPGQVILEPFAGGGAMVMECIRQKRNVVGLEKEDVWFPILTENLKRFHVSLNPKAVFK